MVSCICATTEKFNNFDQLKDFSPDNLQTYFEKNYVHERSRGKF